ncbi:MAG: DUF4190 domain-containing protein [Pseudoxanthomonas suwonensis]|nr:DUF4190 domain-containing protein [Pseudoxanthomonas suwonensis]
MHAPLPPPSATAATPGPTNVLAVLSLVAGILGWSLLPVIGGIVAIITGHVARGQLARAAGRESGDGLALAGLILGYLSLALLAAAIAFFVLLLFGGAGLLYWTS